MEPLKRLVSMALQQWNSAMPDHIGTVLSSPEFTKIGDIIDVDPELAGIILRRAVEFKLPDVIKWCMTKSPDVECILGIAKYHKTSLVYTMLDNMTTTTYQSVYADLPDKYKAYLDSRS